MSKHYYNYNEELTEEDLRAREEWKNYVRYVDELDRQARIRSRILAATILIVVGMILILIFGGKTIASMIS